MSEPVVIENVVRIGDVLQFEGRRVRVVDIVPLPAGTVIAVKDLPA